MLSFEEYHQKYLKNINESNKYIRTFEKKKTSFTFRIKNIIFLIQSNIKINKVYLLFIPFIFIFPLEIIFPLDIKLNEKNIEINYLLKQQQDIEISFQKKSQDLKSSMVNKIYSEKKIENEKYSILDLQSSVSSFATSLSLKKIDSHSKPKRKIALGNKKNLLDLASLEWKKKYSNKKINFIETLLPIIAYENKKILIERKKLIEIKDFININNTLKTDDINFLKNTAKKYLVDNNNKHKIDLIDELLNSVNIIPNSIVLAQAANESGWGSSRFAKEHNALFGQYTYDEENGVIPNKREEGKKHLIKNFSSIDKSVESYFININTHHAYKNFRYVRNQIYNKNLNINIAVKALTEALNNYAEDKSYIKIINSIIDTNNLTQFDLVNLSFTSS